MNVTGPPKRTVGNTKVTSSNLVVPISVVVGKGLLKVLLGKSNFDIVISRR